jgi:hypothetical protein
MKESDLRIHLILAQVPPGGFAPPPSSVPPPSTSASSATTSPVFNFTPFNSTTAQTSSSSSINIPQMPFGSFPMVLPPFGKFL